MIKRGSEFRIQKISAADDIGNFTFSHIFEENDRPPNINLMGVLTIQPGEVCGFHRHHFESDTYYIVSGEGEYTDNHGVTSMVYPGDAACAYPGEGHALRNAGSTDLVVVAVIPFA